MPNQTLCERINGRSIADVLRQAARAFLPYFIMAIPAGKLNISIGLSGITTRFPAIPPAFTHDFSDAVAATADPWAVKLQALQLAWTAIAPGQ